MVNVSGGFAYIDMSAIFDGAIPTGETQECQLDASIVGRLTQRNKPIVICNLSIEDGDDTKNFSPVVANGYATAGYGTHLKYKFIVVDLETVYEVAIEWDIEDFSATLDVTGVVA